ncbi:hypothetical protein CUR86_02870 [Salinicola acroporae]|uniref:Tox-REase-5 domain-containing protein n=3 Tax=Salinicola acroporae TaxID=1541440 RepID=A0ABT6I1F7_9GAMM|nr:hypothetical protein [Salinicola acroporae]
MAEAGKEVLTTAVDYNLAITREALTAVGVLNDTASESGSDTRSRPVAGEVSDTDTNEDCNDCEPRKRGYKFVPSGRNFNTGDGNWPEYQLKIANMGGNPIFSIVGPNKIEEWKFNSVDFDGFWSASCTLVEAKYGYGSWLERNIEGEWQPRSIPFMSKLIDSFISEASAQSVAIRKNMPPATLNWFFSDSHVKELTEDEFSETGLIISCHLKGF